MSIEQQIEELRAELSWCDDAVERRQIEAELRAAETQWRRGRRSIPGPENMIPLASRR